MEESNLKKGISWLNGLAAFVLLGGLIWALTIMKECSGERNKALTHCTEAATDSIVKLIYMTKMSDPIVHEINHYTQGATVFEVVPALVDTLEIVKNYFSKYSSTDTIKDKDLLGILHFTINKNRMIRDSFIYKILRPDIETIISHTIIPEKKNGFFLGFNAGFSMYNNRPGFGPEGMIITKKDKAIGAGYDFLNKTISAKFLIKL